MSRVVDLPRVRAALARLDALAAEHPEAFAGRTAADWIDTLQENDTMQTVAKGRPVEGAEPTTQIAIRVPASLLAQLDAFAAEHAQPGLALTRSDAVRMIMASAFDAPKGKSNQPSSPRKGR
ncbi:MAG: hypothetical protein HY898_35155 [Deltaproteobacteria bacterium]|nr:hypothetical protein [Deltaproteobacteria bacterium]